jgi:hypothetical protein
MLDPHWPSFLIDGAITLFLVLTIVHVSRLNNRLAQLRQDREGLGDTVKALQQSTQQAETAVGGLKLTAGEAGHGLQALIDRGEALKADLAFLIERGEKLADRLENAGKGQRQHASDPPRGPAVKRFEETPQPRSSEPRLATLLRQMEGTSAKAGPSFATPSRSEPEQSPVPQSRAERELKRALEGRR